MSPALAGSRCSVEGRRERKGRKDGKKEELLEKCELGKEQDTAASSRADLGWAWLWDGALRR